MDEDARREILDGQIEYYRARAAEYDDWWFRRGRYDRGAEANRRWFDELTGVRRAAETFRPAGRVLELACGTGLWTELLVRFADDLTAVDASPEMIDLCGRRVKGAPVRFVRADLFEWEPDGAYDVVFFAFWLSHVPAARFERFWRLVGDALAPGGRVFFVDSLATPVSTAADHRLGDLDAPIRTRRLNDGREYEIVKVFHDPARLAADLGRLGWDVAVRTTGEFFLYGSGGRREKTS